MFSCASLTSARVRFYIFCYCEGLNVAPLLKNLDIVPRFSDLSAKSVFIFIFLLKIFETIKPVLLLVSSSSEFYDCIFLANPPSLVSISSYIYPSYSTLGLKPLDFIVVKKVPSSPLRS